MVIIEEKETTDIKHDIQETIDELKELQLEEAQRSDLAEDNEITEFRQNSLETPTDMQF